MAKKIYLTQRTSRHVIKRLDASYAYELSFGTYGTAQTNNTGFNFPWGTTADSSNNIYVCDSKNKRIVKLTSGLVFTASVDVSVEVGRPYAIFFDSTSGDLYVAGIQDYRYLSIAKITTALSILNYDRTLYPSDTNDQPMGISRAFGSDDFLISGMINFLKITETGSFVINSSNNKLDFSDIVGYPISVTITSGTYIATALATEIQTQMNLAGAPFFTYTASYNAGTNKFTIASDSKRLVVSGLNDRIEFEETPGVWKTATIGSYDPILKTQKLYTPAALATEIQARLNERGDSVYTVTFLNGKYTITSNGAGGSGIFNILWNTGRNAIATIANTIGFNLDSDKTGSLSYTSDNGSFNLLWFSGNNSGYSIGNIIGFDITTDDTGSNSYTSDYKKVYGTAAIQTVVGESGTKFLGHTKHSNGFIYLNAHKRNASRIVKVNSSYVNVGDSDDISKMSSYVSEGYTTDVLVYDDDNKKVLRYDANLNFVEVVFADTGDTIQTDADEITGILELDV